MNYLRFVKSIWQDLLVLVDEMPHFLATLGGGLWTLPCIDLIQATICASEIRGFQLPFGGPGRVIISPVVCSCLLKGPYIIFYHGLSPTIHYPQLMD